MLFWEKKTAVFGKRQGPMKFLLFLLFSGKTVDHSFSVVLQKNVHVFKTSEKNFFFSAVHTCTIVHLPGTHPRSYRSFNQNQKRAAPSRSCAIDRLVSLPCCLEHENVKAWLERSRWAYLDNSINSGRVCDKPRPCFPLTVTLASVS